MSAKVTMQTSIGEVTDNGSGDFYADNGVLMKLLEKHGVPEPEKIVPLVIKGYIDAAADVHSTFLKEQVCKTLEPASIRLGCGQQSLVLGLGAKQTISIPQEKGVPPKQVVVYGKPTFKIGLELPAKCRGEGTVYPQIATDVEAAFAAKR